jgi:hypothetical protein
VIGPRPQTPLDVAVQETVQRFRAAIQRGSLSTKLG